MKNDPLFSLRPAQLRLIATIAEHGQLQVAATEVALTQPAASRMLSEVERLVGAPLFIRHRKGMEPTVIGLVVAKRAQAVLRDLRDLGHEVAILKAGRGGSVHVGAVTGPAVGYLVPAIRQIKADSPEADITIEVAPSRQLMRELSSGRLDFALARFLPEFDSAEFDIVPLQDETVRLLVRRGHPLAGRGTVPIGELASADWVMQERGAPIREAVNDAYWAIGLPAPDNIVNTSSLLLTIAYLSGTDAVAPVSNEVVELIVDPPVAAGFVALSPETPIRVAPYLLIKLRHRPLAPLAQRLSDMVLDRARRVQQAALRAPE